MTIPVDFIPDDQFAKARDAALYSIAPGTKTLEAQALDVQAKKNEQDALQEALRLKETARQADMDNSYKTASLGETVRSNNMDNSYKTNALQASLAAAQQKTAAATNTAEINNAKAVSAEVRDNFIAAIRAGGLNHTNYNYKGAFDKMNAHGGFANVTPADLAAILKEVSTLSKSSSGL